MANLTQKNSVVNLFKVVLLAFVLQLILPSFESVFSSQQIIEEGIELLDLTVDDEGVEEIEVIDVYLFFSSLSNVEGIDSLSIAYVNYFRQIKEKYSLIHLEVVTPPPKC